MATREQRPRAPRALILGILIVSAALSGCTAPAPPPDDNTTQPPANDPSSMWPTHVPQANGTRLMDLVRNQVYVDDDPDQVRYRTPGTQGHDDAIPILERMLHDANLTVQNETWTQELTQLGDVQLTNLYGVRQGTNTSTGEIWIAAHWDSRAWADGHRDACTGPPVQGANDGAAGVASVVHAAAQLPRLNHTLRVALFDGEDQGGCGDGPPTYGYIQGSLHAAQQRAQAGTLDEVSALILVDMPGDDALVVPREARSHRDAPRLTTVAFAMAERLEAPAFENETGPGVVDDHVPFLDRGVPAVDLIHLDDDPCRSIFPCTHHTVNDTVENLSLASIEQVTRVVMGTVLALDRGALDTGSQA